MRLSKTIEEAANGAGVNWQTWYLAECGVYNEVPPAIKRFLIESDIWFVLKIGNSYAEFRTSRQKDFGYRYGLKRTTLPAPLLSEAPFRRFREALGLSRSAVSKGLCVQPGVLYRLELGKMREMPSQLVKALRVAGLSEEDIEELNERTTEFYEKRQG